MITSTVTPKLDLKLEKNTKGFNREAKLSQADATNTDEIDAAIALLEYTKGQMEAKYGAGTAVIGGGAA